MNRPTRVPVGAGRPVPCSLWRGSLADFADRVVWAEAGAPVGWPALAEPLGRFHQAVGGPWGPACSLWGQLSFNALLIPVACLLAEEDPPQVGLDGLVPSHCLSTGQPGPLGLRPNRGGAGFGPDLVRLIDRDLRHLVEALHATGGLSRRMLWESAALAWAWVAGEIATLDPGASGRLVRRVASLPVAALQGAMTPARPTREASCGRRFCCLRHLVPGWQACPGICPREMGRAGCRASAPPVGGARP